MIYFVRHGQTDDNINNRYTGKTDTPLNATGLEQAKATALKLKDVHFDVVYCSPWTRAKQTAKEIMKYHKHTPIFYDDRLLERDDGELEGQAVLPQDFYRWILALDKDTIYGEKIEDVYLRLKDFYQEIMSKHCDENVLIVAHKGVGRVSRYYFLGAPESGNLEDYAMDNAEVVILKQ